MGTRVIAPGTQQLLGSRLELCIQGISEFFRRSLSSDTYRLDASIIVFADTPHLLREFSEVTAENRAIQPLGPDRPYTGLGETAKLALQLLENQMSLYQTAGQSCFRPLLILITAARENHGTPELFQMMGSTYARLIREKRISVTAYAASPGASLELLQQLFPGAECKRVDAFVLSELLASLPKPDGTALPLPPDPHASASTVPEAPDDFILSLWNI